MQRCAVKRMPELPSCCILLDVRAPWLVEFASALARQTRVSAYSSSPETLGLFSSALRTFSMDDPPLEVTRFPVQRGYFSFPLRYLLNEQRRIVRWLLAGVREPASTWLVCCYPHYSKVADLWPGPVRILRHGSVRQLRRP